MAGTGLTVDDLCPLIKNFFGGISEEQCRLLKQGTPDDATEVLLAELLLEIIGCISKATVASLQSKKPIKEKDILDTVKDSLSQSFAQELNIEEDDVPCSLLTKQIVTEVTASVNSSIADREQEENFINQHTTPPNKLSTMVQQIGKLIKWILSRPLTRRMRSKLTPEEEAIEGAAPTCVTPVEEFINFDLDSDDEVEVEVEEPPVEIKSEKLTPEDAALSKHLEEILKNSLTELTGSLIERTVEPECERQRSESLIEIESLGTEIFKNLSVASIRGLPLESLKGKSRLYHRVKIFFAKQYAKTLVYRLLHHLKTKFHFSTKARSKKSLKALMEGVDSLILMDDVNKVVCVSGPTRNRYVFKKLNALIYACFQPKKAAVHKRLYAYIANRVRTFLCLLNWWSTQQLDSQSQKVVLSILESQVVSQTMLAWTTAAEKAEVSGDEKSAGSTKNSAQSQSTGSAKSSAQSERMIKRREKNRKMASYLVATVMSKMFADYKIYKPYADKMEAIIETITKTSQAAVEEEVDWEITSRMLDQFYKAIIKDLSTHSGSVDLFVFSAYTNQAGIEDFVISTFTSYLTSPPQKRKSLFRFFTSIGKVLPGRC